MKAEFNRLIARKLAASLDLLTAAYLVWYSYSPLPCSSVVYETFLFGQNISADC